MSIRKKRDKNIDDKCDVLYIPLDNIKTLHDAYLSEIESEKKRLTEIRDPDVIKAFHTTLLKSYNGAISIKNRECKVDYDIKVSEIKARAEEQTPVRHGWTWRFLFRPLTNRAQDIIEERAELEAERMHTAAEKQLDDDWQRLFPKKQKKQSKRELRRLAKIKLKETIEAADSMETNEVLNEQPAAPMEKLEPVTEPEKAQSQAAPTNDVKPMPEPLGKAAKQLPGQMTFDAMQTQESANKPAQVQPQAATRRPRPPRSCRKP